MEKVKYAFVKSLPVLAGYIFLGIAFGIVLEEAGYNYIWAFFMSVFVFAGSMQFAMVPLMAAGVSPLTMAVTALFVNGRHIFYGLSFIDSFKKLKGRLYLIFAMSDETYSVLCGCKNEDPQEKKSDAWILIALFDQVYWIIGSVIGAIIGEVLPVDFTGIDFSMTALFVIILLEQILVKPKQNGIIAGMSFVVSILLLFVLGTSNFLLPAFVMAVCLVAIYSKLDKNTAKEAIGDE